ncbi:GMC oxidoreductase [Fomitiporia mediterranea MF3/22]|uniref:GMC oxidoreductase n=1 Tax=Fomitiporia mediterranea (strain MF3/22) TaxID=694068 RepID=UPI00044084D8|nr:GMC oxidoreductase [Fomitiporia mediterranea MF3/22]EJD02524.1 GMC oxidoreductase [Fomitiporia mediterranea MF3/22]
MSAAIQDVSGKTFDYVIIGGGTAGLTIAARLTEDSNISVLVLEAGLERIGDPNIGKAIASPFNIYFSFLIFGMHALDIPAQYGIHFGDPRYAWDFTTVPQVHANNHSIAWPRGKVLGGSSAINFFVWNKPPAADIDAWEALGNPGWNWSRYNEYSKKCEGFSVPDEELSKKYRQEYKVDSYGSSGPIKITFPSVVAEPEIPFHQALLNAGIKVAKDPNNGDVCVPRPLRPRHKLTIFIMQPIGTWMAPCNLDPKSHTRSYAATAFYRPNAERPNLRVLCDALVHHIVTDRKSHKDVSDNLVKACAVEFEYEGNAHSVSVAREVIVSAGALKSPQILELSGIGNKNILDHLGIESKINLPGVGENMQEHFYSGVIFELDPKYGFETLDSFTDAAYKEAQLSLHAKGQGAYRTSISSITFLPLSAISSTEKAREIITRERECIKIKKEKGSLLPGLYEQYEKLFDFFENGPGGESEIVCFPGWFGKGSPEPGKKYITILLNLNRPFSRGTIHVTSKDPHAQPEMDPHYFEEPIDLELLAETLKFIRKIAEVEPFKDIIVREVAPGSSVDGDGAIQEYIKDNIGTTFHTAGTLSMLPRSLNGVVDANLRVYGTQNIRIADLSIVPLHVAAHTQSTAYTIGEQAADIIRGRISEVRNT